MKVSQYAAELFIEEIAKVSGLTFKHPDRLTRGEARAVMDWARQSPEVARAATDKSSPFHKGIMAYKAVVDHFAFQHPQNSAGEPEAWPARASRPAAIAGKPFSDLFPDEAEALRAWSETSAEYQAALYDAAHPQHKIVVERTNALFERINAGAGAVASESGAAPVKDDPGADAAFAKRLDELRADPAYLDPSKPGHKAAVEKVTRAYEERATGAAPVPPLGAVEAAVGSVGAKPGDKIAAMKDNAAYFDKSHPGHAAAVQEVTQAFAAANSESSP